MPSDLFKKVEVVSPAEIIAERFDDALDLMHKDALVYGGAIRDMAAGLPILGDLDIAAAGIIYNHTVSFFRMSSKWTEMRQGPILSSLMDGAIKKSGGPIPSRKKAAPKLRQAPVKKSSTNPYSSKSITAVTTFETFDNAKVQVMMSSSNDPTKESTTSTIEIIKNVDIRCCGLALDSKGNVYEIVDGAYQDCIDRVLRINKVDDDLELEYLEDRIKKLKARGWTSKINISNIRTRLKKKEQEKKKAAAEWEKRRTKKQSYNEWMTIEKTDEDRYYNVTVHGKMVSKIGSYSRMEKLVSNAGHMRGVGIHRNEPLPSGGWRVMVASNTGAHSLCKELWKQIKLFISGKKTVLNVKTSGRTRPERKKPAKYKKYSAYRDPGLRTPEDRMGETVKRPEVSVQYMDMDVEGPADDEPEEVPTFATADYFMAGSDTVKLSTAVEADEATDYAMFDGTVEAVGHDEATDYFMSDDTVEPNEIVEPPEADEHTHHMQAVIRGHAIHIDSTNRDMAPGEPLTIDVSNVPGGMIAEVIEQLRNVSEDLVFQPINRNTIQATPRGQGATGWGAGIIIPENVADASNKLNKFKQKTRKTRWKKRR